MEKSLFRAFIFSLLIFLVLNFLFCIITYSMGDIIEEFMFDPIAAHPSHAIHLTIYPVRYFPWELITTFFDRVSDESVFYLYFLGGFISFVIAAIIAGIMGTDISQSFWGWVLTSICYMSLFIAILAIDEYNLRYIDYDATLADGIVLILITGITSMFIFGGLVILIGYITRES